MLPFGVRTGLLRSEIEQAVRRTLYGSTPTWKRRPNAVPWFDRADALGALEGDGSDRALLEHGVRGGYVVVDDCIQREDIYRMVAGARAQSPLSTS